MEQAKPFFLSDGVNRFGPFAKTDVVSLIFNNKISLYDQVFDQRSNIWMGIFKHEDFQSIESDLNANEKEMATDKHFQDQKSIDFKNLSLKKGAPLIGHARPNSKLIKSELVGPVQSTSGRSRKKPLKAYWHLKKKDIESGPHHYLSIATLFRERQIDPKDLIRAQDEYMWHQVEKVFSADEFKKIVDLSAWKKTEVLNENLSRRKDPRTQFPRLIFVQLNEQNYIARGNDLSAGGVSFLSLIPYPQGSVQLDIAMVDKQGELLSLHGNVIRSTPIADEKLNTPFYQIAVQLEQALTSEVMARLVS